MFVRNLLYLLLTILAVSGNPLSLGGEDVDSPYSSCPTYPLGGKRGFQITKVQPMGDNSELAFYPMDEGNTILGLHIMLPSSNFKVIIEGSMITLEKCHGRSNCQEVAQEGVKGDNFVKPQEWNRVKVSLSQKTLAIYVEDLMVKSMSMVDEEDLQKSAWSVFLPKSNLGNKGSKTSQENVQYLVQFLCQDYVTTTAESKTFTTDLREETDATTDEAVTKDPHETTEANTHATPAPHIDDSGSEEGDSSLVGLIVGVVIAIILLAALVIIIYNVIKKRRSATINESAPLQKTTK